MTYLKTISDTCNMQKALGCNPNGVARGPLVRTFLGTFEKEKVMRRRLNYEDQGKDMLNHDCLKEELKKISIFFFTEKSHIRGCTDRICSFLPHAILCCSQTTLGIELLIFFCGSCKPRVYRMHCSDCYN